MGATEEVREGGSGPSQRATLFLLEEHIAPNLRLEAEKFEAKNVRIGENSSNMFMSAEKRF